MTIGNKCKSGIQYIYFFAEKKINSNKNSIISSINIGRQFIFINFFSNFELLRCGRATERERQRQREGNRIISGNNFLQRKLQNKVFFFN